LKQIKDGTDGYLGNVGLDAAAAGLVGNAIAESQLNPRAVLDSGTGYGIYGASPRELVEVSAKNDGTSFVAGLPASSAGKSASPLSMPRIGKGRASMRKNAASVSRFRNVTPA
jgi:hypothetical protein